MSNTLLVRDKRIRRTKRQIAMSEWTDFFASVHTSKGVYKQPKINVNAFLETGERDEPIAKLKPKGSGKTEVLKSETPKAQLCEKSEDPQFIEKLREALGFVKTGLPPGTTLKLAINYAINLIKPDEGKEELWFQAISYENHVAELKLTHIPKKVKYLKEGGSIKPSLDKIESFYFKEP